MSQPNFEPNDGNVDILVHFSEKKGQPLEIRNVDPDRFGVFNAHECINMLAEDEGMTYCKNWSISYLNKLIGQILPLKDDRDVLNMWEVNAGARYCHLYVSRPMLLIEGPKNNEGGDVGTESVVQNINSDGSHNLAMVNAVVACEIEPEAELVDETPVADFGNVASEEGGEINNDVAADTENEDEVYVSDEDEVYVSDEDEDYVYEIECSESEDDNASDDEYSSDGGDGKNSDQGDDFSEKYDVIGEEHDDDDDKEEIYVERGKIGQQFKFQHDGSIQLDVGQLFLNVDHFRSILYDFAIQDGFELKRLKNERKRVTCKCMAKGCKWRIHASPTPDGVTFKIKTYQGEHNCIRSLRNRNATSTWIAKKLETMLTADPNISYATMKQELLSKYGIEPSNLMQLYRAKRRVHQSSRGVHSLSYNELPPWAMLVRSTNKGSVVKIEVDHSIGRNPQFKRLFVCLDALKKGFVRGCRPWFGIDGCHLKGPYGGILLSAVGLDGNKGMFPIAVGVVEIECKDSWRFFLTLLSEALQTVDEWKEERLTIMSDMQKGIRQAVADIFPYAKHRFCCNHMLNHFKQRFRSLMLTTSFWSCAMAYSEVQFEKSLSALRKVSNEAADWLVGADRPKTMWARYTADSICKSDHVTNNICEVFNAWLGDDRRKTVLALFESLHCRFMTKIQKRFEEGSGDQHFLTPRIRKLLDNKMQEGRFCFVTYGGQDEFQVADGQSIFVVDLGKRTCGCHYWRLTGIPCKHVCACVAYKRGDIQSFVDIAYHTNTYLKAYAEIVHPMPEVDPNKRGGFPYITAPSLKRLPGRPRKARKKSEVEGPSGVGVGRRSNTLKCTTCNNFGHNSRTCQRAPVKGKKSKGKKSQKVAESQVAESQVAESTITANATSHVQVNTQQSGVDAGPSNVQPTCTTTTTT